MNEHEGVALVLEYTNTSIQLVLAYASILSAFLVMSYLSANKLNGALTACVLTLFSLVCFLLMIQMLHIRTDLVHLVSYLHEQQANGVTDVPWFGNNSPLGSQVASILQMLVTIGGYFSCVGYFLYQRSRDT
jgi:hypothetical protein